MLKVRTCTHCARSSRRGKEGHLYSYSKGWMGRRSKVIDSSGRKRGEKAAGGGRGQGGGLEGSRGRLQKEVTARGGMDTHM